MSKQTAVYWASFCLEVVFDGMIDKREKIGGPGKIVEIDESKFGKRKYHRGHHVEGAWVFGGIERGTGKIFMEVIDRRDKETLFDAVEKWILPGTTIYSDCWKGYSKMREDPRFTTLQVNHSLHFKDPETEVHTNSIEYSWRHAKASIPTVNRKRVYYWLFGQTYKKDYLEWFIANCTQLDEHARNVNPRNVSYSSHLSDLISKFTLPNLLVNYILNDKSRFEINFK